MVPQQPNEPERRQMWSATDLPEQEIKHNQRKNTWNSSGGQLQIPRNHHGQQTEFHPTH